MKIFIALGLFSLLCSPSYASFGNLKSNLEKSIVRFCGTDAGQKGVAISKVCSQQQLMLVSLDFKIRLAKGYLPGRELDSDVTVSDYLESFVAGIIPKTSNAINPNDVFLILLLSLHEVCGLNSDRLQNVLKSSKVRRFCASSSNQKLFAIQTHEALSSLGVFAPNYVKKFASSGEATVGDYEEYILNELQPIR